MNAPVIMPEAIRIPVFATKFATAYPAPKNGVNVTLRRIADAFTRLYATDAHIAGYSTTEPRRLNNAAIGKVPISMVLLFWDVDDPIADRLKQPARPEWRAEMGPKRTALLRRHPGAFLYQTRGGERIVLRLGRPFPSPPRERKTLVGDLQPSRLYLRREFGIVADPACKDFGRLFRLPNVARDGQAERHPPIGDAANIEAINLALFAPTTDAHPFVPPYSVRRSRRPAPPRAENETTCSIARRSRWAASYRSTSRTRSSRTLC